jgi:transcriptional regulator with XRE-family HTH domain
MATSQISGALRAARARRGLSREALAFHSGMSWSAIAQIESGRRTDVRLNSLVALARALGVTVDYLVGGDAGRSATMLGHQAAFFRTDDEFLAATVPFLAEGVEQGDATLAVTTASRLKLLRGALDRSQARQVKLADSARWYASPAAAVRAYRDFVGKSLDRGMAWARVVGEPVWARRSKSETASWARYESLINVAFATTPVTFVCPYDAASVTQSVLAQARCTHPEVLADGTLSPSPVYCAPEDYLL